MLKNFAPKLIAAALLVSPLASFAQPSTGSFSYYHQPGFSMQLASGIDYAYYTKDHTYTVGIYGLTYVYQVGGTDVDGFNQIDRLLCHRMISQRWCTISLAQGLALSHLQPLQAHLKSSLLLEVAQSS